MPNAQTHQPQALTVQNILVAAYITTGILRMLGYRCYLIGDLACAAYGVVVNHVDVPCIVELVVFGGDGKTGEEMKLSLATCYQAYFVLRRSTNGGRHDLFMKVKDVRGPQTGPYKECKINIIMARTPTDMPPALPNECIGRDRRYALPLPSLKVLILVELARWYYNYTDGREAMQDRAFHLEERVSELLWRVRYINQERGMNVWYPCPETLHVDAGIWIKKFMEERPLSTSVWPLIGYTVVQRPVQFTTYRVVSTVW